MIKAYEHVPAHIIFGFRKPLFHLVLKAFDIRTEQTTTGAATAGCRIRSVAADAAVTALDGLTGAAAAGDYAFNVGGSFSISRRIDVTAGVRYASERDRLMPAANSSPDNEAVYVGTKIRF